MVVAKVSAIQDISRSPVLMSGAGTSIPGPAPHKQLIIHALTSSATCGGAFLTDEAFLGELDGKPSSDFLQLHVLKTQTVQFKLKHTEHINPFRESLLVFTVSYSLKLCVKV